MHEDKLTHDERLRLECIAQAVQTLIVVRPAGSLGQSVIEIARQYEGYLNPQPAAAP